MPRSSRYAKIALGVTLALAQRQTDQCVRTSLRVPLPWCLSTLILGFDPIARVGELGKT